MIGFRDRRNPGPHPVTIGNVPLVFDDHGVLWDPTPEQLRVLEGHPLRKARFERVEPLGDGSQQPLAGDAFVQAAREEFGPASSSQPVVDEDDGMGTFD